MTSDREWERKDAWLGVLFLVSGILIVIFAIGAMTIDLPIWYRGLAWIIGPLLVIIGGNAIYRAVLAWRTGER